MSTKEKTKIAAIVGATASGKTSLSISLAKKYNGEIVSCDSMQIYKEMNIGTAKPSIEEMDGVPHHMIDVCHPRQKFSCSDYAEMALGCINDIIARGKLPILCGGTGLYLDSLLRGVRDDGATEDAAFREEMQRFAEYFGADALHAKLKEIDPEAAEKIHKNNVRRVIRALEVFHTTGKTKTQLDALSREKEERFDPLVIYLHYSNRDILYSRIDKRVDTMMEAGLMEEARRLYESDLLSPDTTAGQAIGYKEFFPFFEGKSTLDEALEQLKLDTRHYAKRQMTWFSAKKNFSKLEVCSEIEEYQTKTFEEIVNNAEILFNNFGFCGIIDK